MTLLAPANLYYRVTLTRSGGNATFVFALTDSTGFASVPYGTGAEFGNPGDADEVLAIAEAVVDVMNSNSALGYNDYAISGIEAQGDVTTVYAP